MSWSIQQVARLSGITARTLRYYDEIGLLTPERIGSNGYRYYGQEQLLRLQHILVLRALGLDLATIGGVVDAERDPLEALRRHRRRLLDDRGRIDRLVATVSATIDHLEKGIDMPAENMFDGFYFGPDYLTQLETDHAERTGESEQPEIAEVKRNTSEWSSDDFNSFNAEGADVTRRLATLLRDGVGPDADETLVVLDEDMALQRKLWTPEKGSYVALARALDEPSELRSYYNSHDPHLAEYIRDAMLAYADRKMS